MAAANDQVRQRLTRAALGGAALCIAAHGPATTRCEHARAGAARVPCALRSATGVATPACAACRAPPPDRLPPSAAAASPPPPPPPQSFARRDLLLRLQAESQAKWEAARAFEANAPDDGSAGTPEEKFFGTFPYPYMNGLLHLGHAFSLSKLEFAAAYHRLCGKRVLFPQGFHCTGMPIKACADRLAREIAERGAPPRVVDAAAAEAEAEAAAELAAAEAAAAGPADPSKFAGKKSKAVAKAGAGATQWEILAMSGVPESKIPAFSDPVHWLRHFPPRAARDMRAMGCGVDWRRSFITTDLNPFYDAFVRWQMRALRAAGKVVKDKRLAVFSPLDGQPCADHDRASGEGVGPQDYTLVKMRALELRGALAPLADAAPAGVFLLAATLRPETMVGQTNAWALPDGEYVAVRAPGGEAWVLAARAARNLAHQDALPTWGEVEVLARVRGADLIGTPLASPHAPHARIFVLPLLTILMSKGTGIVTSVPSDAPDDFAALRDLKTKPKLREKFGVADEWVLPYDPVPIIEVPGLGTLAAVTVCEEMKIASQNDAKKLAEAKQLVYMRGFTEGVLVAGPRAGERVATAKPLIRAEMLAAGEAVAYSEPERAVTSRSGDECVVALTDQWYITYGEEEWRGAAAAALARAETFDPACRRAFEAALAWLSQWACSRSFGLGTRLPWDPEFLVESLSDSTVYMAYYAVAGILQAGDMYCDAPGAAPGGVPAAALTDGVFDFVFLRADAPPADCAVPAPVLARMRREFEYWYPMDLRVSGKDLIQNHLTFCLYSHAAVWAGRPDLWPRAVRCNGHLLLNAEKMSKSTGNFKTLGEAIAEYSADAMRVALADAGDAMDDANFEAATANGAILRLTKEVAWLEEALAAEGLRDEAPASFVDRVFDNEISAAVAAARSAYDRLAFREALKVGWYDLLIARDQYRFAVGPEGLNRRLVERFADVSTRLLAPVAPHTCEHVWGAVLRRPALLVAAGWPAAPAPDPALRAAAAAVEATLGALRKAVARAEAPPKARKGAPAAPSPGRVAAVELVVPATYGGWQARVLELLLALWDAAAGAFPEDLTPLVFKAAAADPAIAALGPKALKADVMPFAKAKAEAAAGGGGAAALAERLPYDEAGLLRENAAYLARALRLEPGAVTVRAVAYAEQAAAAEAEVAAAAPGAPAALLRVMPHAAA